ncbi:hypothetical protein ACL02R_15825 [Streptomyces sp. MS19]|uniref:hypothetical protein n=1 Tax=Streptomyces sp. MS19 TaxID=3385972 RepID=UPI0039A0316A
MVSRSAGMAPGVTPLVSAASPSGAARAGPGGPCALLPPARRAGVVRGAADAGACGGLGGSPPP